MAVTVGEDVYTTVAEADTYATENFMGADLVAWNGASTSDKEASLRQATQYIDNRFRDRFVGFIRSESQALEWPRNNAIDRSGRVITQVPDAVKDASVELAKERILNGVTLVPSLGRGGKVKRQKVDVIEVEFMDNAPSETVYQFVHDLLSVVLKSASRRVVRV